MATSMLHGPQPHRQVGPILFLRGYAQGQLHLAALRVQPDEPGPRPNEV